MERTMIGVPYGAAEQAAAARLLVVPPEAARDHGGPLRVAVFYIWVPGERFKAHTDALVKSYTEHPAGCAHDLVIVCKSDLLPVTEMIQLPAMSVQMVGEGGFDLGPFLRLAPLFADYDRLVMLGAYSRILADDWLVKLTRAGPLAAATSSFEVRAHLRTNCISIRPDLLEGIAPPVTKRDCWEIEHGEQSIYRRALARGVEGLVVGCEGAYTEDGWVDSGTYRIGEQENLICADNHTDAYARSNTAEKAQFEHCTWAGRPSRVAPITVLTVTIAGREQTLVNNVRSVYAQSAPIARQLLVAQHPSKTNGQVQYSAAKNDLLSAVDTEWIAVLNDDDVWLGHHVRMMLPHLDDADVIYSWDAAGSRPRVDCNDWNRRRLEEYWEKGNFLDGNCLIRTSLLQRVGGFPVDWVGAGVNDGGHYKGSVTCYEDWELWRRLLKVGARFRCVPVETWRYGVDTVGRLSG